MSVYPPKIILGSQSPRRQEILSTAGFNLIIIKPDVEELFPEDMDYYQAPEYIAKLKLAAVYKHLGHDEAFIICADTVVIFEQKLLGKPSDLQEAYAFLKAMNGKEHDVVTGVAIRKNGKEISFAALAKVKFKLLTDKEVNDYVEVFKPLDKAGAYNIQEYPGFDTVIGEYENVMGLPIQRVLEEIRNWELS